MGKPVNSLRSPRFCGIRPFQRLPHETDVSGNDFAVMGVPFDTGTSYRAGCRFGPAAIREVSAILKPYNHVLDVDVFEHLEGVDAGDMDIIPGYVDESFAVIERETARLCSQGATPVLLGGDHSVTLPELRGLTRTHGPVALLHFDAHSDTGNDFFGKPHNHGTTFYWAMEEGLVLPNQSSQIGIRGPLYSRDAWAYARSKGMQILDGWQVHALGTAETIRRARERVRPGTPVFVSFDIDFLDAACAPGTGTPEVGGFTTHDALALVQGICPGLNLVGMDMVEVLPEADHGAVTSLAAANIIFAFLSCLAHNRRGRK